jgi:hypothetical protein
MAEVEAEIGQQAQGREMRGAKWSTTSASSKFDYFQKNTKQ